MPRSNKGYWINGERVPGTTTVISRFKDSGGITYWAWDIAYKPYRSARALIEKVATQGSVDAALIHECKMALSIPTEKYDYRAARESAASIGTIVHARIDAFVRRLEFSPSDYVSPEFPDPIGASNVGFNAFIEWAKSTAFELVEGEMQLTSPTYRYGGTPDVLMVQGQKTPGDWKTGNLYPEQLLPQLAAYEQLLIEAGKIDGGKGAHAMSVNKETGGFVHRYFTPDEVAAGFKVFKLMRELYDLIKDLK